MLRGKTKYFEVYHYLLFTSSLYSRILERKSPFQEFEVISEPACEVPCSLSLQQQSVEEKNVSLLKEFILKSKVTGNTTKSKLSTHHPSSSIIHHPSSPTQTSSDEGDF
jgi:hypothetical protein